MRLLTAAVAACLAVLAGSTIALPPPPSHLAREVVVLWTGSRDQRRLARPGRHRLPFPCSHEEGRTAPLEIEIVRMQKAGAAGGEGYQQRRPEEVLQSAQAGRREAVQFRDSVRESLPVASGAAVLVAGRGRISVGQAFVTDGRVVCLVPREGALAALARSAVPGAEVLVRGRVVDFCDEEAHVLVDGMELSASNLLSDEPPWTVTVRWSDRVVREIETPGDYALRLPCPHSEGAVEQVWVRLREFRMVRLDVGAHPVYAELADTPAKRSHGVQGRAGLEPDRGMLFFFPEPIRPTMVMKTVSFPLSIAFIDAEGTIVNIERLNPRDRRGATSRVPVNYVLEMSQGWFRAHGVAPGARMTIP